MSLDRLINKRLFDMRKMLYDSHYKKKRLEI